MSRAKGRALWLPDILRDAGLPIIVEPGFETRGKDPIEWVAQVNHHTASNRNGGVEPSRRIVRDGRGGAHPVPGPLANTLPRRDGVIRIIASGAANHPGVAYLPLRGGISSGVKYWTLGHEIELDGIGEPFPTDGAQYEAVHRMNAAIAIYLGHDRATQLYDHKSIARPVGRKIDVHPYDLAAARIHVRGLMHPQPKGFLMALSDAEQRELLTKTRRIDAALRSGVKLHPTDLTRARVNETNGLLVGKGKRLGMFRRNVAAAVRDAAKG